MDRLLENRMEVTEPVCTRVTGEASIGAQDERLRRARAWKENGGGFTLRHWSGATVNHAMDTVPSTIALSCHTLKAELKSMMRRSVPMATETGTRCRDERGRDGIATIYKKKITLTSYKYNGIFTKGSEIFRKGEWCVCWLLVHDGLSAVDFNWRR
ncbi:unnamed protein product, partial [Ixodes hexagonus]